jgi:hypothetical protein
LYPSERCCFISIRQSRCSRCGSRLFPGLWMRWRVWALFSR